MTQTRATFADLEPGLLLYADGMSFPGVRVLRLSQSSVTLQWQDEVASEFTVSARRFDETFWCLDPQDMSGVAERQRRADARRMGK